MQTQDRDTYHLENCLGARDGVYQAHSGHVDYGLSYHTGKLMERLLPETNHHWEQQLLKRHQLAASRHGQVCTLLAK